MSQIREIKLDWIRRMQNRLSKWMRLALLALLLGVATQSQAQDHRPAIRTGVKGSEVYVYNTFDFAPGEGFNVYRSSGGTGFEKLNDQPVMGAQGVAEFMGEVGEYNGILQEALGLDTPMQVYLKLRSSRLSANLATFYYPEVAKALGHLYVDPSAPVGREVTYRIEVVDEQGRPTGKKLEKQVRLEKTPAPQPKALEASHNRRQVTLSWSYPTSSREHDDKIVRFNIYNRKNGSLQKINKKPIIRINNFEHFKQVFNVPHEGVTLNLVVMPVSLTGDEGPASEELRYTVSDQTPPSVVAGLEAVAGDEGNVEITWPVSIEPDAAGYNLFRAGRIKGTYKKLNDEPIPLLKTLYVDRPPKLHKTYFYRVSAIDSAGNESRRSNAAKADVEDHVPPAAPVAFHAEPLKDGSVQLSWKPAEKAADFKSYILLRRQGGHFAGKADVQLNKADLTDTTYVDRGEADIDLAEGARYQYAIFVIDSTRNFSDTLKAVVKIPDTTPPEAPTRLTVENDGGVWAILRWNASRSTDVSQYLLYRSENRDSLQVYRTLDVSRRFWRDDSVQKGHTYYYAVGAVDSLGNKGPQTAIDTLRMKDFTPPRAVRNVRATLVGDKVEITWEPVTSPDLKGYRVYTSTIPTGTYQPVNENPIIETRLSSAGIDRAAWIRVRAVDSSGNESTSSKPVSVYIPEQGRQ